MAISSSAGIRIRLSARISTADKSGGRIAGKPARAREQGAHGRETSWSKTAPLTLLISGPCRLGVQAIIAPLCKLLLGNLIGIRQVSQGFTIEDVLGGLGSRFLNERQRAFQKTAAITFIIAFAGKANGRSAADATLSLTLVGLGRAAAEVAIVCGLRMSGRRDSKIARSKAKHTIASVS
ncbi:hypothetical protein KC363_g7 [Hortaea werneckii]|nr:hypothetical protein KC363_g7 [Hortaea werneckii]